MQTTSNFPQAFSCYRPRSQKVYGVILISDEDKVLLVKGRKTSKWSFPKGHIKPSESWSECAFRECYEETGISLDHLIPNHPKKLFSGYYYIYNNIQETKPNTNDSAEILEVAWVPIDKIHSLKRNIDVNNFLDSYDLIRMNLL